MPTTPGAIATYDYSYTSSQRGKLSLGVKAYGADLHLSTSVAPSHSVTVAYALAGGSDYELHELVEGCGLISGTYRSWLIGAALLRPPRESLRRRSVRSVHARVLVSELRAETAGTVAYHGESESGQEPFLDSLLQQVYGTLAEAGDVLPLRVHRLTDQSDAVGRMYATNVFAARDAIHFGLQFASNLNAALLVIAGYLTKTSYGR